jgi:hypothetical protein
MILGYLLVSAIFTVLFWVILIVAKRSDERTTLDFSDDESKEQELQNVTQ